MPIRPSERARYPSDWRAISDRIRLGRAEGRCECEGECGLHSGRRCVELHHTPAQYARGRVVLTVAHLDHVPEHCEDGNLRAMCQRCHLRYDRDHHAATARATRRERARAAGQERLL